MKGFRTLKRPDCLFIIRRAAHAQATQEWRVSLEIQQMSTGAFGASLRIAQIMRLGYEHGRRYKEPAKGDPDYGL